MKQISTEKLNKIATDADALYADFQSGIQWAEHYLKAEEKTEVVNRLKKFRRDFKKAHYSFLQKPAAALYGESQVGKSYLIKNLLSVSGKEFEVVDPQTETAYDFLEFINPKGDQTEATSVVTRFTNDRMYFDDRYPIAVKLLSPKDVVLFLIDSYFSDISDHRESPSKEEIQNKIEKITTEFSHLTTPVQAFFTEDDIYDIQEYLEKYFRRNTAIFTDAGFWDAVAVLIQYVTPRQWFRIFKIIWGELRPFDDIFNRLISELERLSFSEFIFIEFDALLRKYGTILHVARLRELEHGPVFEDVARENYRSNVNTVVKTADNITEITVDKSVLCALCGELILQVSDEVTYSKEFLKSSDLLDFPGARSRLENRESSIGKEHIDLMVLRGKVSYIFNKYSGERLISSLLFCNKDAKIEVKYIPKLLNNWIENYIGATPEERAETLKEASVPPIFIIFTFFNNDLRFNEKNDRSDNLHEKWIKRFITIFENEIVTKNFNWHTNWSLQERNFQNFYLLRDFTHSKETYKGYAESKSEKGLSDTHFGGKFANPTDYLSQLESSFLNFDFVKKHFKSPKQAWDEAAKPQNDGSNLIINQLVAATKESLRQERLSSLLGSYLRHFTETIERHYHSDKKDEQIRNAARIGGEIHANMNAVFGKDPYNFGRFIRTFTISESRIYNFFHEKLKSPDLVKKTNLNPYIYFREYSKELSKHKKYEENISVLQKDYDFADAEKVETFFAEKGIDLHELFYGDLNNLQNFSFTLAEELKKFWFDNYLIRSRFDPFIEDGFSASAIDRLLDNFKASFDRQQIVNLISENIKQHVNGYRINNQAEEMIADISAGTINRFVNSVGWDFYSQNEIDKLKAANEANSLNLNLPGKEEVFESIREDALPRLFSDVDKLNENLSKSPPDEEAIKNVPLIIQLRRWRDLMKISFVANCNIPQYDPKGNEKLGILCGKLKQYDFSIT